MAKIYDLTTAKFISRDGLKGAIIKANSSEPFKGLNKEGVSQLEGIFKKLIDYDKK